MSDPYAILGVRKDAPQAEIKKTYRRLAKDMHPDRNPDDPGIEEKFKKVSAAYRIIGDEETRARYDRGEINAEGQEQAPFGFGGSSGFGGRGGFGGAGGRDGFRSTGGGGFEDIFGDFFNNMRGGPGGAGAGRGGQPQQSRDRKYTLTVDFLEAARGANRRLNLPNGKTLDIKIPEGLDDGQQIRLKGQGDRGAGGRVGDAIITVSVRSHPLFERQDRNIHIELPLSLTEAVLGGRITVPTVHGDVTVQLPRGSNTGKTIRLKGKGLLNPRTGTNGDQLVRFKIVLPEADDPELEAFVREWRGGQEHNPRKDLKTG